MMILDLVERVSGVADGNVVTVPLTSPGDQNLVAAWCDRTANRLLTADDLRGRAADPIAVLPADRVPGARLWLSNFDRAPAAFTEPGRGTAGCEVKATPSV